MKLDSSISAVITGGASGLGAATARRLAAAGVKVALFDLNAAAGEALAAELGGVFCAVDVTQEDQVDAGFAKARAAIGQERILVNCAGTGNAIKTASRDKATGEIRAFPTANFERIIQINLIGTFRCIAKSAAGMLSLPALEGGERLGVANPHVADAPAPSFRDEAVVDVEAAIGLPLVEVGHPGLRTKRLAGPGVVCAHEPER